VTLPGISLCISALTRIVDFFQKKIFVFSLLSYLAKVQKIYFRLGIRDIQVATPRQNSLGGVPPRLNFLVC
jgi:hypothetical protein